MNKPEAMCNRLLYDKEKMKVYFIFTNLSKEHEMHVARLRTVKSCLDNRAPKKYNHLS